MDLLQIEVLLLFPNKKLNIQIKLLQLLGRDSIKMINHLRIFFLLYLVMTQSLCNNISRCKTEVVYQCLLPHKIIKLGLLLQVKLQLDQIPIMVDLYRMEAILKMTGLDTWKDHKNHRYGILKKDLQWLVTTNLLQTILQVTRL